MKKNATVFLNLRRHSKVIKTFKVKIQFIIIKCFICICSLSSIYICILLTLLVKGQIVRDFFTSKRSLARRKFSGVIDRMLGHEIRTGSFIPRKNVFLFFHCVLHSCRWTSLNWMFENCKWLFIPSSDVIDPNKWY